MKYEKQLCGKCMNMLEAAGYRVRRVQRGIDMKVVCENCGKKHYGGIYEILSGKDEKRDQNTDRRHEPR